jgi:ABC-type enterochelin transport system ATPase subunit
LSKTFLDYQKLFNQSLVKRDVLLKRQKEYNNKLNILKLRLDKIEQAQLFLQLTAKEIQENIKFHIEDIVQLAIDSCFPDKYRFELEFVLKRNKTEANLNFYENNRVIDPMTAAGGGLVNIACFAVLIAGWSLSRNSPVIMLDEPFKDLSDDLQYKAMEILKELSDKLGFQIILFTHKREVIMDISNEIADKIFEVELRKDGEYSKSVVYVRKG